MILEPILRNLENKSSPAFIGNRIKSARMLCGLNRTQFANSVGISIATLRAWEEPSKNRKGLTHKGAARLVQAFIKHDIDCTEEWLMKGKGVGPKLITNSFKNVLNSIDDQSWNEEEAVFKDLNSFKENNLNAIVAIVNDNSMLPFYAYGDYVGGTKISGKKIMSLIGLNCIIETQDTIFIRKIAMKNDDSYTLVSLNQDSTVIIPVINDIKIISAAEIIWHRKRATNLIIS